MALGQNQKLGPDPRETRSIQSAISLLICTILASCALTPEEPELAVFMGHLQRHSHKLGLAIDARNQPLAEFYLTEVEEVLEDIAEEASEYDGWPIANLIETITGPALKPLRADIEASNWEATRPDYSALITSCNRCHTATEHEFLVILPPDPGAPFNQSFAHPKGLPEE